MNIGPYHVLYYDDNGIDNKNGRDYSNIEFLDHPTSDAWGRSGGLLENLCYPD